ncbi:winged helix-turn-helix transcriptional regulator [Plantactinospora sonchi]|uniref:Helix-turn-helix domain-containing protein n=1 Tax=Plantactinospora sonchi TaxID=1544735 RepID=A0ABU7RVB2_9ACTN
MSGQLVDVHTFNRFIELLCDSSVRRHHVGGPRTLNQGVQPVGGDRTGSASGWVGNLDRLRELQADGLIVRHDRGTNPPHVEYRLTGEGLSLPPVLQALYDWGTGRAARTGTTIQQVG